MSLGELIVLRYVLALHIPMLHVRYDWADLLQKIGILILALLVFDDCGGRLGAAFPPLVYHLLASAAAPLVIAKLVTVLLYDHVYPAIRQQMSSLPNELWQGLPVLLSLLACVAAAPTVDGLARDVMAALRI